MTGGHGKDAAAPGVLKAGASYQWPRGFFRDKLNGKASVI